MKCARVAVITRTKNRPILFSRAYRSVSNQTYKDIIWVIVNDGGDRSYVDETADIAMSAGLSVQIVHNDISLGMEAASNIGIHSVNSDYIVIHDDDDSWNSGFLEKTVNLMDSNLGNSFGGVVTQSMKVVETIKAKECRFVFQQPFNEWMEFVYLSDMVKSNLFPPISFLFRRKIYDKVGGFNESLPVLGDWDFNLRFLLEADVYCIPELLANYHFRDENANIDYRNTVVCGVDKHKIFNMVLQNKYLREDIGSNVIGLGFCMAMARYFNHLDGQISPIYSVLLKLANSRFGRFFIKRIGL